MSALTGTALTLLMLLAAFGPLERLWPARRQPWLRPELFTDLCFYLGQAFCFGPLAEAALTRLHPVLELGAGVRAAVGAQPLWLQAVEVVLLSDLCVYAFHRASHASPLLWRFHRVHHTSTTLDWLAAHREHPVDGLLTQLAINLPAISLGFPLRLLVPLAVFRGLWAIYIHSNARLPLGPLRYLLGAPELHHWHHALHPERVQNFANLAPWTDLLFGTFQLPKGEETYALGVPEPTPSSWLGQLLSPFVPTAKAEAATPPARPAGAA